MSNKPKLLEAIQTKKTNERRAVTPRIILSMRQEILSMRQEFDPMMHTMPLQKGMMTELRLTTTGYARDEHLEKVSRMQRKEIYHYLMGDILGKVNELLHSAYDLGDQEMIDKMEDFNRWLRYE